MRRKSIRKRPKSTSRRAGLSESELEAKFLNLCIEFKLPQPTQQYIFHPQRRWRLDFAWPEHKLAVEIQGFGTGHTSYKGMQSDYEKHNEALLLGWRFLYFMGADLVAPNLFQTINIVRLSLDRSTHNSPTPNSNSTPVPVHAFNPVPKSTNSRLVPVPHSVSAPNSADSAVPSTNPSSEKPEPFINPIDRARRKLDQIANRKSRD